jgi:dihydrofolate reductase
MSLDGYIARRDGDLVGLNGALREGVDYGFAETMQRTGAYIMGANTYREMVKSGMGGGGGTPTYVVTHDPSPPRKGKVTLYSGDLGALVERVKGETEKDICVFGGGALLTQMVERDLMDEVGVSIIPALLGDGAPFWGKLAGLKRLELAECKRFESGIVALTYRLARERGRGK